LVMVCAMRLIPACGGRPKVRKRTIILEIALTIKKWEKARGVLSEPILIYE